MDYCDACRRQLNGAVSCPGCGTVYRLPAPAGRKDHADGAHQPHPSTALEYVFDTGPLPGGRTEVDADAGPPKGRRSADRRRGRLLVPGAVAVVVCVAVGAMVLPGLLSGSSRPAAVTGATDTEAAVTTGAVPEPVTPGTATAGATSGTRPSLTSVTVTPALTTGPQGSPDTSGTLAASPSATGSASPRSSPAPTSGPAGAASVVGAGGRCLTAGQDTGYGGTTLLLATCRGTAAQHWRALPDGTLRNGTGDRCLDLLDARTDAGSPVQLFACNTTPAQTWVHNGSQELFNPASGRCLDAAQLSIMDCTGGSGQRWRMPTG
ncbi:ricin-type beta-trefoil lectin domain protein [Streptomyces flaveolus]|uniref:RICIN domain-containing protein n=1 Tax=Streptomyces flaveolus TaxID=67297 RepID=UPI0033B8E9F1